MSHDEELPPNVVAAMDQNYAELTHLVRLAKEHQKNCDAPTEDGNMARLCPGPGIFNHIWSMETLHARRLLLMMISMSARDEAPWLLEH